MTTHQPDQENAPPLSPKNTVEPPVLHASLLSKIVAKIEHEPFLFIIAIVALITGAVVVGAGLGSATLRYIIAVIALLAIAAIGGYYLLGTVQTEPTTQFGKKPKSERWQFMRSRKGIKKTKQMGENQDLQYMEAEEIEDVVQSSKTRPS